METKVIDGAIYIDTDDLRELCEYIREHAARIFVRAPVDDGWGSVALADLPTSHAITFTLVCIERWLDNPGYRPVRVKADEEG